jgi:hypothetical protein
MKQIVISYDEANKNIAVSSVGLTEGEALAILIESHLTLKDAIINAMKKRSSGIVTPASGAIPFINKA